MNGAHDMGGMHGFGTVEPEPNEPMFHADGKARVSRWTLAMGMPRRLEHRHVALRPRGPCRREDYLSKSLLPDLALGPRDGCCWSAG